MSADGKRYAVVGTGSRSLLYIDALVGDFAQRSKLVAFCDRSSRRMDWHNNRLRTKHSAPAVQTYRAEEFDRMIAETKPDFVVVLSVDATHHHYIVRAMELGCDVISEKPMTTTAESTRAIFDAMRRTGRQVRVTFNMRYIPAAAKVYELMRDGVIGAPTAIDLSWFLDTRHGADYFRRWHRDKSNSGGLLVHKSSHHFDLVNWWIDSFPKTVFAMGGVKFYGRANAEARGETNRTGYDRYTNAEAAAKDPFALSLQNDATLKGLYLDAEEESGYIRDQNVFGDNITAEDTMAVMVRYRNGVILNYSLVAYSPREGWNAVITGTKGRIEISARYGKHIVPELADPAGAPVEHDDQHYKITVLPMFGYPYPVEVENLGGSHGGGDRLMFEHLFGQSSAEQDAYGRPANHISGAAAILVGISANRSIETEQVVQCDDLIRL